MPEERTIVETLYTFDELDDRGKDKAREIVGGWNAEWEAECMTYQFEEFLAERGLPIEKIEWSLSSCQGDGVAFYGSIDVEKYLRFLKSWSQFRLLHKYKPVASIH